MSNSKNIAIIGSGPISLFEAIYQAKLGNNVVVYEAKDRLGGAWANIKYNKQYDLELGCHIWDVDKEAYLFLSAFLDQPLNRVKPKPKVSYKKRYYPYDWKNNVFLIRSFKKNPSKIRVGKFVFFPRTYKYPNKGSIELIEKLVNSCKVYGVKIYKDVVIDLIIETKDGWALNLNNTQQEFDELILTSFSSLKEIRSLNQRIIPEFKTVNFTHYHIVVSDPHFKKKISYLRVMDHHFIHRVSDMSDYSDKNANKVFAVGVFKKKIQDNTEEDIRLEIFNFLKQSNIISKESSLRDYFINNYKVDKLKNTQLKSIKQLKGITVLNSNNFIYSIRDNLYRWKQEFT